MEELQRLRAKRRALKGSATKLLAKVDGALDTELETVNVESTPESRRILVATTAEQLRAKREQIISLDSRIAEMIQDEDELESDMCDADTYQTTLEQQITMLKEFVRKADQLPTAARPTHPPLVTGDTRPVPSPVRSMPVTSSSTEATVSSLPHTEVTEAPIHSDSTPTDMSDTISHEIPTRTSRESRDTHMAYSRLPKLHLPSFDGSPLQWQMFWDSFSAAVDSNPCLTGIQKLNYLRAQLQGDASRVISGFPLSDINYTHSVELLRQRFGQQFKLVDAHMDALLNVSPPSNTLASLQTFYDTLQSHIRALSALGKPSQSYGSLLTTAILNKLPPDIKIHMARDHYNAEWNIDDLLAMVLREIQILEAGLPVGRKHSSTRPSTIPTTASFYTATHKPPQARDKTKRDPTCAFCKGTHKTSSCTSITCPKERLAIVKSAGLCFNCLARHKVSQCTSKFNCRECHKKHHTTLCRAFATTTRPPQQNQPQLDTVSSANSAVPPTNTLTSANSTATSTISDLQPTTKQTLTTMTPPPLSALHSSICLLKTAIADVSGDSTTVEGHILFDEGAQRSFITQELANILQLTPVRHELITVSSFGAQISTPTRFAVTSISIHTLNGGKIPISVLIVPKLTAPIRNSIRTNLDQFPYLQELTLAHPITSDENFHVSVLIGADYFWQFVQDQVVRGNGPTAVQSRLGYLLSGPLLLPQSTDTAGLNVSVLSCTTEDATQRSFWNVESTGTTRIMKNSDTEFLHKYMATKIAVQPDGAYSLKFPWKDSHPPFPPTTLFVIEELDPWFTGWQRHLDF